MGTGPPLAVVFDQNGLAQFRPVLEMKQLSGTEQQAPKHVRFLEIIVK